MASTVICDACSTSLPLWELANEVSYLKRWNLSGTDDIGSWSTTERDNIERSAANCQLCRRILDNFQCIERSLPVVYLSDQYTKLDEDSQQELVTVWTGIGVRRYESHRESDKGLITLIRCHRHITSVWGSVNFELATWASPGIPQHHTQTAYLPRY